ncbi:NUDIX-domain-containing protein [Trichodelitschia bisporula]|uniref:NUDIX-domain-containing protein n=1 Tax=Trichodelitschia bisporula TaxID=703511 RepID=A0A6G1HMP9_9PEZI|nr:NUDIX-domain-containing protein [Trichodelitschia bisporula]
MSPSSAASSSVPASGLVQHLRATLLDLHAHPYPTITNPPNVPRRASVALVLRIQPHHAHFPPESSTPLADSQFVSGAGRISAFFEQDWAAHGDPEVLFIKRAARSGDKWTSHIAFPGGRRDPEDADDEAAAVRETWEEVGLRLSEEVAVPAGNLPQRVVTASWGKKPLMVLCPYIYLLTTPDTPTLRLQPTEVASTHWVPLRALLSPAQRTYWYQDIASRVAKTDLGMKFHQLAVGDMMFAAVRLVPSETKHCTSIAEFLPDEPIHAERDTTNLTVPLFGVPKTPPRPVDGPLLLWGLSLGVMGDLLDMLPPYTAFQAWTYPTFTAPDIKLVLWILSYRFRARKQKEIERGRRAVPAVELGLDSIAFTDDGGHPSSVGIDGLGVGRYYGRVRQDAQGTRSETVGVLLQGYYDIILWAVPVAFALRATVAAAVGYACWRKLKR